MLLDVVFDGGLQRNDGMEDTALETLSGQGGEEVFDGIQPGARGRREVEGPAWVTDEPLSHLGMFVGGIVVEDDVDHLAGRHFTLDGVQETQEFLVAVLLHTATDDRAVENVERGEQGGCAVAFVVMRECPATARLDRQAWLGAIKRLDLRFLVDRQHQTVRWRIDIKTDDVMELLGEGRIIGALECLNTMRLQIMLRPDPLHRAMGERRLPRPWRGRSNA